MLLTCPKCQSGLQVPDGTTAHVRCPACKLVFPAEDGLTPAEPVPPPPPAPRPRPAPPRPAPQRYAPEPPENRDFDPIPDGEQAKKPKRRRADDGKLSPEERAEMKAQFVRGMWGCRLISFGFGAQALGLFLMVMQLALAAFGARTLALLAVAGIGGLVNLVLVPVGLGLVLAARPAPGLYRFGVAAAVAIGVHAVFLLAVLIRHDPVPGFGGEPVPSGFQTLGDLLTKMDTLTTYLLWLLFPGSSQYIFQVFALDFLCGVAELVRLILVMITLTAVARAAGDKELVYRCVRAGGIGSLGPFALAAVMPLYVAGTFVASQMFTATAGLILLIVGLMGIYAVLAGMLVPATVAARDAAEACEFPFQTEIVDSG